MGTATAGRTSAALFLCALWFAGGCAATKLVTQDVAGPDMATISFTRTFSMLAAASPLHLADRGSGATGAALNGQTGAPGAEAGGGSSPLNRPSLKTRVISQVGPGGTLTWHRPPGILRLEATGLHPSIPCYKVEAGKTYAIEYDYRTGRVACFHPSADPAMPPEPVAPFPDPKVLDARWEAAAAGERRWLLYGDDTADPAFSIVSGLGRRSCTLEPKTSHLTYYFPRYLKGQRMDEVVRQLGAPKTATMSKHFTELVFRDSVNLTDPAWLRVPTFAAAKAAADRLNLANAEVELTIRMLDWKAAGASWRLLVR